MQHKIVYQNRFLTIMKLQQLVEALDAQILKGDIVGAFDAFAADNCVTLSNPQDKTQTKSQKLEILRWFFQNIASVNRIERLAFQAGDTTTDSQFVFDFTNRQGESLVFNEVIRRTWKNGKVVEEQYLVGQTIGAPKTSAAKTPSKKDAAQEVQPAAAKTAVVAEPKAAKKPAAKPVAKAAEAKPAAKATTEPNAAKKPAAKTTEAKTAKPAAKSDKPKAGRK